MARRTVRIAVADVSGADTALIVEHLGVCGFLQYDIERLDSRRAAVEALTGARYDCVFVTPDASREWALDCAVWDALESQGPEPIYILDPGQIVIGGAECIVRDRMQCPALIYAISNAMRRRARRVARPTAQPALTLTPSS